MQQKIIILDFGSQTTQLIGRRVRELDTFCEIMPYNKFPKDDPSVIGVILSGSPYSVSRCLASAMAHSSFLTPTVERLRQPTLVSTDAPISSTSMPRIRCSTDLLRTRRCG